MESKVMARFVFNKVRNLITAGFFCLLPLTAIAVPNIYTPHYLVSDGFVPADHIDPNLINPWGIAFAPPTHPVWVANNGSGTSTLYNGLGVSLPLIVNIPAAPSVGGVGKPTGIAYNNTAGWHVTNAGRSAPATFLFATKDGTISGWEPTINATQAIIAVDNSASQADYTGLTIGANGSLILLYVANFYSGHIEVYDSGFHPITLAGDFTDPGIPAGFAPFNVQNIHGDIYVSYAKQDATKHNPVKKAGFGYVTLFNSRGQYLRRIATEDKLNAPYGMAFAPASFGKYSNHFLVGNYGDGKINCYDPVTNQYRARLHDVNGSLVIKGLLGLSFGNGALIQPTNILFFAAGPDNGVHGAYGNITPISEG